MKIAITDIHGIRHEHEVPVTKGKPRPYPLDEDDAPTADGGRMKERECAFGKDRMLMERFRVPGQEWSEWQPVAGYDPDKMQAEQLAYVWRANTEPVIPRGLDFHCETALTQARMARKACAGLKQPIEHLDCVIEQLEEMAAKLKAAKEEA